MDGVVNTELQAIARGMIPLVDKLLTSDKALVAVSDGVTGAGLTFLSNFPCFGTPYSSHDVTSF